MSYELKKAAEELKLVWETELKPRIESNESGLTEVKMAIDRVQDHMDQIEARAQKGSSFVPSSSDNFLSQERKDLMHFTRNGSLPRESKILTIRDETTGGVLAPPDFIAEVVKGIIQFSPIRSLATVRQTSRTSIQFPKRTGNFAAAWTSETGTRTETTGRTYGLEEIPNHELYARVLVSNWDLEDPAVNLEPIIRDDMAEQFGKSEGAAFVDGSGVGQPEGLLTNSDVLAGYTPNGNTSFVDGASGSKSGADGIIDMTFAIKEQYWPNARYVLNRFTLRDLRTLKDAQGNYLWQIAPDGFHGMSSGLPATLYGYPYTIAVDMPDVASNAYPVLFGDFSKAYWVVDRIELQYLRDPYSEASEGVVVLHARKRVGGQVVLPEAINVLKMSAS